MYVTGRDVWVAWAVTGTLGASTMVVVPWLLGFSFRRSGVAVPDLAKRSAFAAIYTVGAAVITMFPAPIFAFALASLAGLSDPESWALPVLGVVLAVVMFVGLVWLRLRPWPIRKWMIVAIAALPLAVGFGFMLSTGYTFSRYWIGRPKSEIDATNMRAIRAAMEQYSHDHGAYPDDLRRLVDAKVAQYEILISPFSDNAGVVRFAFDDLLGPGGRMRDETARDVRESGTGDVKCG